MTNKKFKDLNFALSSARINHLGSVTRKAIFDKKLKFTQCSGGSCPQLFLPFGLDTKLVRYVKTWLWFNLLQQNLRVQKVKVGLNFADN